MNTYNSSLNCVIVDDEEISRTFIKQFVDKTSFLSLVNVCKNGLEALELLQQNKNIDILFLDIRMPELNGMDLLKLIERNHLSIILVTAQKEYAIEAFEENITDYLLKPINYPRFLQAVYKVKEKQDKKQTEENNPYEPFFVKTEQKFIKINPKDILYIEALSDYILIHTTDKQKYIVHYTMKGIDEQLAFTKIFARVHRSYIVNILHIDTIQDISITVRKKSIPIGRSYKNDFMNKINLL